MKEVNLMSILSKGETFDKEYSTVSVNDALVAMNDAITEVHSLTEKRLINQFIIPLKKVIDYLWEDEMINYESHTGYTIQSNDDLNDWIHICERDNETHIFYHLMKLKQLLIDNKVYDTGKDN